MKKQILLFSAIILVILLLSVSFVSASLGDILRKLFGERDSSITGMATSSPTPSTNPPTATLSANPTTGEAPLTVSFQFYCSDPDNNLVLCALNFGDNSAVPYISDGGSAISEQIQNIYNEGTYLVNLTAIDSGGLTDSKIITIAVSQASTSETTPTPTPTVLPSPTPTLTIPIQTCVDSDGKNYFIKGTAVKTSGTTTSSMTDKCSGNVLVEYYCENKDIKSENYNCPQGCLDGKCIEEECETHQLTITEIFNDDGNIAIIYQSASVSADNLQIQLISISYSVYESDGMPTGTGGGGSVNCEIKAGTCGASSNEMVSCSAYTECAYPEIEQGERYYIKIQDNQCPDVSDTFEIKSGRTCKDTDGGVNYFVPGAVTGFKTATGVLEEKGLEFSDGLAVVSPQKAILKINGEEKEVSFGTYDFGFGEISINKINYYGLNNPDNNIEYSATNVKDFCNENTLTEFACSSSDELLDYKYECVNGCKNGACLTKAPEIFYFKSCSFDWNSVNFLGNSVVISAGVTDEKHETAVDSSQVFVSSQSTGGIGSARLMSGRVLEIKIIQPTGGEVSGTVPIKLYAKGPNKIGTMHLSFSSAERSEQHEVEEENCVSGGVGGGERKIVSSCGDGICQTSLDETHKNCPQDCEFKEKDYEDNEDDLFSESCEGCIFEEKCVKYGYRQENEYCDTDGKFKEQVGSWESCLESYECISNICSQQGCVDIKHMIQNTARFKSFFVRIYCRISHLFNNDNYNVCLGKNMLGDF